MLKAKVTDDDGTVRLFFGLSAQNVERMMNGQPIKIDLRDLGADKGLVFIFYGKTEEDMRQALEDAGIELPEKPS